ncbi:MAG TPA: 3'-5' exonuclease [Candidatus Acidoferrales bacterium]|nr:3'-5' exonuclease [Candidatus Acidoferrales bacterium]
MSKDLSIDIETLGVNSNAPVLSIGYCWFNYDKPEIEPTGKGHTAFDINEQTRKYGRVIHADTVKWWFNQSDSARSAVFPANQSSFPGFIERLTAMLNAADQVWAKGPDFDCVILKDLVEACGHDYKWPFWKHRCVRTMTELFPSIITDVRMSGNAHNALDDAVHQANQIRAIAQALGRGV